MITKKQFIEGSFNNKPKRKSRRDHPIYVFLKKNKLNAFKTKEISAKIKMKESTTRSMLSELIKDKLVSHKTPYFIVRR